MALIDSSDAGAFLATAASNSRSHDDGSAIDAPASASVTPPTAGLRSGAPDVPEIEDIEEGEEGEEAAGAVDDVSPRQARAKARSAVRVRWR
jgi:hypothetical protein